MSMVFVPRMISEHILHPMVLLFAGGLFRFFSLFSAFGALNQRVPLRDRIFLANLPLFYGLFSLLYS